MVSAARSVTLLGATGSIGASAVDLLARHPERFRVEAVAAGSRAPELAEVARRLGARLAVVNDERALGELKDALAGSGVEAAAGRAALLEAASRPVDVSVAAIVGAAGLEATFAAARVAGVLALANKESLVCAGGLLMKAARAAGTAVLPTDSEHNAVFQALGGLDASGAEEIVLTASGGPFRTTPHAELRAVTPDRALRHPTWSMGAKITIDSATLVNKGLELIEAHHLFDVPPARLSVLVHPQSVVHGLVRFRDGSLIAQLGPADMRVPIAAALAWPERIESGAEPLDLARLGALTFEAPDLDRFPGLALARAAMEEGGGAPCAFNAANEVAVEAFLAGRLGFVGVPELASAVLDAARTRGLTRAPGSLEDVLAIDRASRALAAQLAPQIAATSW
jgi:1-deoxy-D-xylulose-5-phosphate reductoisomerase